MKTCPKCGGTVTGDARFCPEDGTLLVPASVATPAGPAAEPASAARAAIDVPVHGWTQFITAVDADGLPKIDAAPIATPTGPGPGPGSGSTAPPPAAAGPVVVSAPNAATIILGMEAPVLPVVSQAVEEETPLPAIAPASVVVAEAPALDLSAQSTAPLKVPASVMAGMEVPTRGWTQAMPAAAVAEFTEAATRTALAPAAAPKSATVPMTPVRAPAKVSASDDDLVPATYSRGPLRAVGVLALVAVLGTALYLLLHAR